MGMKRPQISDGRRKKIIRGAINVPGVQKSGEQKEEEEEEEEGEEEEGEEEEEEEKEEEEEICKIAVGRGRPRPTLCQGGSITEKLV